MSQDKMTFLFVLYLFVCKTESCVSPCEESVGESTYSPEGSLEIGPTSYETNMNKVSRYRRDTPRPDLTVELFFVIDYAAYLLWSNLADTFIAGRQWSAKVNVTEKMIDFYTLHVQGVNERFENVHSSFLVNIELTGMYVATLPTKQPWLCYNGSQNGSYPSFTSVNQSINVNSSMHAFRKWTTEQFGNNPADHYIWITGHDLGRNKSFGYNESMCSNRSISVIQEELDFIIQTRIAHQIGRSLGLTLDSKENYCTDAGYVMTPYIRPLPEDGSHLWEFSGCSENELESVVESTKRSCLLQNNGHALMLPPNFTLPGIYTKADHQCGIVFGPNFTVCRIKYGNHYSGICYGLMCCNNSGIVHTIIPMEGTPCDTYKYCVNGECVEAPPGHSTSHPKTCLFGDSLEVFGGPGNQSCWMAVDHDKSLCYDPKFRSNCCWSCGKVDSYDIPGCPYGDRRDCDDVHSWECYDNDILGECCRTCASYRLPQKPGCEYGDRRDKCDQIKLTECYQNETRFECCQYCDENKNGPVGCEYGNKVPNCGDLNVSQCYDSQTRDDCCRFCEEHRTGPTGCPYGDRGTDCEASLCYSYSENKRTQNCCKTCGPDSGPTVGATITKVDTTITAQSESTSVSATVTNSRTAPSSGETYTGVIIGASVGGVMLVLVLIIAFICWKKRRGSEPKHLSPITDVMYNEYKMSKRAPIPEPRNFQKPKPNSKQKLVKQDSDVYAYINPEDVESVPSKTGTDIHLQNGLQNHGRHEDDPLPPTPADYLELEAADKYGYLEPVYKTRNKPNPYSEPYSDNQTTAYTNEKQDPNYKHISSLKVGRGSELNQRL